LTGRFGTRLIRDWNRVGLIKKQGKEKLGETRLVRQVDPVRPGCKLVDFCFFFLLKRRRFDFKKKLTWWPDQNPKPESWTRPARKPGLKTMLLSVNSLCFYDIKKIDFLPSSFSQVQKGIYFLFIFFPFSVKRRVYNSILLRSRDSRKIILTRLSP
jgi:hypothetical protein